MTGSFLINLAHLPSDYWFRYHVYEDSAATKTDWTNLWRQANASYAPHRLFVPSVYMHRRVFPDDAYESINYATIGSLIARQAASAHDLTGRHVDADGHRVTWMKDSERAVQDRIIGCVVEAFQNRYNGTPVATSVDRSALYDAWASLSPLLGALHFSPGFTEQSSGFQRYNPQQLFFMSLCFNACGQGEDGVRGFSAAAWCNIPLSLFRPFWDSFQCQEGSRMRSSVTCDEM
ncbi:hypothetical protein HPB48_006221 [Haemaphysalis longicornis]|uniref:Peptidase M13 C-terminal domain-containing protein n=1 Tax=Haemaphysalis longicornis TaxID=44386 RepID=A0A9J6FU29_HAELO|nr:hypothetical protein HPB48_006221 [Haemaphysalis longicornis]